MVEVVKVFCTQEKFLSKIKECFMVEVVRVSATWLYAKHLYVYCLGDLTIHSNLVFRIFVQIQQVLSNVVLSSKTYEVKKNNAMLIHNMAHVNIFA